MASGNEVLAIYERVCDSYHNIDDFRMKLLGLLPIATGTGVFFLLNANAKSIDSDASGRVAAAFAAIGFFGFLFTVGLYAYELFGIKRCHYLIETGRRLERDLSIWGQFRSRPSDLAGFVAEPFATSVIYPGSLAAWLFLAVVLTNWVVAIVLAAIVLVVGCTLTIQGVRRMAENQMLEELVLEQAASQDGTTEIKVAEALRIDPARMRRILGRLLQHGDLIAEGESALRLRTRAGASVVVKST
jgi:hypothetical protein